MYILKNAVRNIFRAKGKNILIGVIILIIGVSCSLALSIRQAALSARAQSLKNLNITASIEIDREKLISEIQAQGQDGSISEATREELREAMTSSLSLDDLKKYATAESVSDFFYQQSVSMNATDALQAITSNDSQNRVIMNDGGREGGPGGGIGGFTQGDFTLLGYSSYDAMSEFKAGTREISDGEIFTLEDENQVIISSELATYNNLAVGDTIQLVNPNNTDEIYELKVVGLYKNTGSTSDNGGFRGFSDPANMILTNTKTTESMVAASAKNTTNETNSTQLMSTLNGTSY